MTHIYAYDNDGNYICYELLESINVPEKVQYSGDCNADGKTDVIDVVYLQKWILSAKNSKLTDAQAADLNGDGVVDVFDLGLLKRKLINK